MTPWAWYVGIGGLALVGFIVARAAWIAAHLPIREARNSPRAYLARVAETSPPPGETRVVLIGDSITHGLVGVNYVAELERRFAGDPGTAGDRTWTFINAGVNNEMAYNALQRLDDVIACDPAHVVILIGTNDVNARVNARPLAHYVKKRGLPRPPSMAWYRELMVTLLARLQERTDARLAVLSLPLIGEDLTARPNQEIRAYSALLRDLARETGVTYLPLTETMVAHLQALPARAVATKAKQPFAKQEWITAKAIVRHYFFGTSFDAIAHANGFHVLLDYLHLNGVGAGMVADLVEGFLRAGKPHGAVEEGKEGGGGEGKSVQEPHD